MGTLLAFALGALVVGLTGWFWHRGQMDAERVALESATAAYADQAYRFERRFIESLSIYSDYATPAREAELRRYLLADHLAAAERYGIAPIREAGEIAGLVKSGELVEVAGSAESGFFYYNVRKQYRYLTPGAAAGLDAIAERLQRVLREKDAARREAREAETLPALPLVKFAVSSALRPVAYQSGLRGRNANASLRSSHSAAVSFDIFYDEYFVRLPDIAAGDAPIPAAEEQLRRRMGFWLGAALRRQFRAALTETLLQLQREGMLYAILEKRQRCYHVTILR